MIKSSGSGIRTLDSDLGSMTHSLCALGQVTCFSEGGNAGHCKQQLDRREAAGNRWDPKRLQVPAFTLFVEFHLHLMGQVH